MSESEMMPASGEGRAASAAPAGSSSEEPFDWDELLLLVGEQKVIPIVGKELLVVSIDGRETLLEHHLAVRLAEALGVARERLSAQCDLNEVAVAYVESGGRPAKIYPRLKAIVEERPLAVPEPLRKLAAITDFKLFVSTTFDSLLAEALDLERRAGAAAARTLTFSTHSALQDLPCEVAGLAAPHVFQVFGRLSASADYAVTEEDTLEFLHALQSETRQPKILFDELKNNPLLFLGCSFPDWLARFFVRTLGNKRLLPPEGVRFVVDRRVRSDLSLALFLRHCKTEIDPAGDPLAFVSELHRRWQERRPAAGPEEDRRPAAAGMKLGAIFLSFASEDRDAARSLKDMLESAGLDVWFDEKSIPPGASWDLEIQANVRRCSLFLPLLSQHAARRLEGYFRREWRWAIARAEGMDESLPFIQPIVIDDLQPSSSGIPNAFWDRQCRRFPMARPTPEFIEQAREAIRSMRLREPAHP
ncbi:MAG TPA: toll/interleukin-1 receptor domain-containing protein [Thermoanaerobaculia bacterium]|nr:toll/interleukin-1 receptor domain-containing protein [Thermoanaerobaculia bacterium]